MIIILIVGASGSGKTTIGKELEKKGFGQLVSFTTRKKRYNENEGVDYYFVNEDDINDEDLAEWSEYNGNRYGLFKTEVNEKLEKFENVYFVTNADGASQMVDMYPDITEYYWLDVSIDVMKRRMIGRGDRVPDVISRIKHSMTYDELTPPKKDGIDIVILNADKGVSELVEEILS